MKFRGEDLDTPLLLVLSKSDLMKLGCVPYLNALPLTFFLDPLEFERIARPPAQLLDLLLKGKVDAALLPIVDYFENPRLQLIPDLAIGAKGTVESVKLFLKNKSQAVEKVRNIYLDTESKTSQLLLKSLLHHYYRVPLPKISFVTQNGDPRIEAELKIGDKALASHDSKTVDLGQIWWEWTKKPFVFAAWMTLRSEASDLTQALQNARDRGLEKIDEIIKTINPRQWGGFNLKQYFTKSVHYYMGPEELEGIRTFFESLKPITGYRHGLDFRFVS